MSSLGGSTVSSSYNRLLVLPAGGGDGNNLVTLSDGDNATTFALKVSANAISINTGEKFYLDGGTDSYITESESGIVQFVTDGKTALKLDNNGETIISSNTLRIGDEDNTSPAIVLQSQVSTNGDTVLHTIRPAGTGYGSDVLLLGRNDNVASSTTNVVLNAKVGIGTHYLYPTGPEYALRVMGTNQQANDYYPQFIADTDTTAGVGGTAITSLGVNSVGSEGWARGYTTVKHSDITGAPLMQFGFHGSVNSIHRAFIGKGYSDYILSCETDNRRVAIVGGTTGVVTDGWGGSVGGDDATGTTEYNPDGILTIQQGTDDSNILTFKSTDVNHLYTAAAETDTYALFKKRGASNGGLDLEVFGESTVSQGFQLHVAAGDMSTTQATGFAGMIDFFVEKINASGVLQDDITTNGNVFTIGGRIGGNARRIFTVDASGDLHCDGAGSLTVYDTYDDAHLVRAIDSSGDNVKGLIKSKWDDYIQYNEDTLIDAGILGDKIENGGMTNITRLQRLHNGAIWQQYEQFQNLLQAFTKVSNEVIGKEATKELLDSNNIKKLGDA